MTKFLIYFFPALIDMALGTVFFVCPVRMAESGASALTVTAVITAWAVSYMITSQIAGFFVNMKNAAKILICACLCISVISFLFIVFPGIYFQYLWMVCIGIAAALFFGPFQTFMKAVEGGESKGIIRSTGLYTFSWSTGLACGPFVSAFIWEGAGWKWCHGVNILIGLLTVIGILFLKHHANSEPATHTKKPTEQKTESLVDYSKMPDLAWLGWIGSGIGCIIVSLIRGLFPRTAADLGIVQFNQGMVISLISFTQAFMGLILCRSRYWMYKPLPVAFFGLCGLIAMLLFGISVKTPGFCAAAILFGIYSGGFFFYLVFHSLVHPSRSSRYVAINETIVGAGGIAGPLIGGFIADTAGRGAPYLFSLVVILFAIILQVAVHSKKKAAGI